MTYPCVLCTPLFHRLPCIMELFKQCGQYHVEYISQYPWKHALLHYMQVVTFWSFIQRSIYPCPCLFYVVPHTSTVWVSSSQGYNALSVIVVLSDLIHLLSIVPQSTLPATNNIIKPTVVLLAWWPAIDVVHDCIFPLVHLTGTYQSLLWDPQVGPNTFHDLPRTTRDSEGFTRCGIICVHMYHVWCGIMYVCICKPWVTSLCHRVCAWQTQRAWEGLDYKETEPLNVCEGTLQPSMLYQLAKSSRAIILATSQAINKPGNHI